MRELATNNPKEFLAQYPAGAIIDEVHLASSDLFSYLKVLADTANRKGLFVLSGSQQFAVLARATKLVGRTGLLRLLPLTLAERRQTGASENIEEVLYTGCYPGVFDQKLNPTAAYEEYYNLYIQRDARIANIDPDSEHSGHLVSLNKFVRQCALRIGQTFDLTNVASDANIPRPVADMWLNDLIQCDIVFLVQPYSTNYRKQLTKAPKLYFHDVGLASYLLKVERPDDLTEHRMRGPLFENLVITEALKHRYNRARGNNLAFYRDDSGFECDLIYERANRHAAVEIKSGTNISARWFDTLKKIRRADDEIATTAVVYGGNKPAQHPRGRVIPFTQFSSYLTDFDNTLYHVGARQVADTPPLPKPSKSSIDL